MAPVVQSVFGKDLNMTYSTEVRRTLFNKTGGRCFCCGKSLVWGNYGRRGTSRGRWEIAHNISRAGGGGDHIGNLFPSCISCNRKMGTKHAERYCRRR